jgi:glycosyltransferase involved in cell wall biosynthesis
MAPPTPRIVLVSRFFPPQHSVGGRRIQRMAEYFAGRGWRVSVVTARDRHAGAAAHRAVELGMPGVRVTYATAPRNPVPLSSPRPGIERSSSGAGRSGGARLKAALRAIRDLFVFPDDSNLWIVTSYLASRREIGRAGHVFVLTSAPPASSHAVGVLLKRAFGSRVTWLADFRDPYLYPERDYGRRVVDRMHRRLFRRILADADYLLATTAGTLRTFAQGGTEATRAKGICLPNGILPGLFEGVAPEVLAPGKATFTHLGDLDYDHRNPEPLLRAFGELIREGRVAAEQFEVHFFGEEGRWEGRSVASLARTHGCAQSVFLHEHVEYRRALSIMKGSSVLVLLAESQPLSIPAKTYEYLASGRPVLAFTEAGSATDELVRGIPAIQVVTARRPDEVKAGLLRLMRQQLGTVTGNRSDAPGAPQLDITAHLARLEATLMERQAAGGTPH